MTNLHTKYMKRCLDLALLGAGHVSPNPMVGCVVVYNDKIIGEGWHKKYGDAHAEVNAIQSVNDKSLLAQSTLYVSLEPCSHYGKTPPCANLIAESKIPRVVVAMTDPNPLVAGKGIQLLIDSGVEVVTGICEEEAKALNKRFTWFIQTRRPYIILKWAQTFNGYLSPDASKVTHEVFEQTRHITGKWVQKLVHKWRTEEDAIMVATNTALTDNPALNNRAYEGRPPARVVLDRTLRLPQTLKLFDKSQQTFVINESVNDELENLTYIKVDFAGNWLDEMLVRLGEANIQSLVIEGGGLFLKHVIDQKMWNEAIVFYSKKAIEDGIPAPSVFGRINRQEDFGQVVMTQYIAV